MKMLHLSIDTKMRTDAFRKAHKCSLSPSCAYICTTDAIDIVLCHLTELFVELDDRGQDFCLNDPHT